MGPKSNKQGSRTLVGRTSLHCNFPPRIAARSLGYRCAKRHHVAFTVPEACSHDKIVDGTSLQTLRGKVTYNTSAHSHLSAMDSFLLHHEPRWRGCLRIVTDVSIPYNIRQVLVVGDDQGIINRRLIRRVPFKRPNLDLTLQAYRMVHL